MLVALLDEPTMYGYHSNRFVGLTVNVFGLIAEKLGARLEFNVADDTLAMMALVGDTGFHFFGR